jgi:branched-chain amino acid transport system ATP-binding protein
VLENVRLAAQAQGRDSLKLWARATGLVDYLARSRRALAQVGLAEREADVAATLPHGDKRRLELAILLAGDSELLLLDEPTAGMATEQVPLLLDVLRSIQAHGGKTILIVEHNMGVVMSMSDTVTVMHQGRVLAEGAPGQIAANPEVQRAYLGESYSHGTHA